MKIISEKAYNDIIDGCIDIMDGHWFDVPVSSSPPDTAAAHTFIIAETRCMRTRITNDTAIVNRLLVVEVRRGGVYRRCWLTSVFADDFNDFDGGIHAILPHMYIVEEDVG